jgi:hypothetical protein
LGTSILLSLGLVVAVAVIALSAFIVYATLMRILRDRIVRRRRGADMRDAPDVDVDEDQAG